MEYQSPEQDAAARRMIGGHDPCMGMNDLTLAIPPPLFVGAVAEHLIGERYSGRDSGPVPQPEGQQQQSAGLARNDHEDFALCVVRRDRQGVRAWLRTTPASEEEARAVRPLLLAGFRAAPTTPGLDHRPLSPMGFSV